MLAFLSSRGCLVSSFSPSLLTRVVRLASVNAPAEPELIGSSVLAPSGSRRTLRQTELFISKDVLWRNCKRHFQLHKGAGRNKVSTNKLLNMLRLCGGPVVAEPPAVKVKLAEDIWEQMAEEGIEMDVGIYNIMLRIYNNNDHPVVPSEFLEQMKAKNIYPNMGTFSQLIDAYCRVGNVNGANKLIEYLKTLDMPISEPICASLVTGHARAGNMEAAEEVLSAMKANGQVPHNVVYTRLLCAYAERGNIESVERVFSQMRAERLFPSMGAYTEVINSLSKHGHGSLVARVLDLIKNKEWLSADLRVLICSCVSRGEVEAPRLLLKQLADNKAYTVDRFVLVLYIMACLEQGQPLEQVLRDLKTDIGLSYSPQDFQQLYSDVVGKLWFKHPPEVTGKVERGSPPRAGDLAPHPMGEVWSKSLLDLYRIMQEDSDSSDAAATTSFPGFYYYPLLARHCSDVNLEGFMSTLKQMLTGSLPIKTIVGLYVTKILSNSETTMESYLDGELARVGKDKSAAVDTALFGLLYYCNMGNFRQAQKLVKYFESSDLLSRHSTAFSSAVANGCLSSIDLTQDLVRLFKSLHVLADSPDLTACLHRCSFSYHRQGPVSALVELFFALEQDGVNVVDAKCYLDLLPKLTNFDRPLFLQIYKKLRSGYRLEENDYVTIFLHAVRTKRFGVAQAVYQCLSPATLERTDIRVGHLIYLCFQTSPSSVGDAVKLLDNLLSEGCVPHYSVWYALIPQVAPVDSDLADYLLQQMKECGEVPSQGLRYKLLNIYAQQGNLEKTKAEFDVLVSNGWVGAASCTVMAEVWAEVGDPEQVRNVITMAQTRGLPTSGETFSLSLFLLKSQLKSGDYEGAMDTLKSLKLSKTLVTSPKFYPIFSAYIQAPCSVESMVALLNESSISSSVINSLLFFAYVDCNNEEKASTILKETEVVDTVVFQNQMCNANAAEYMKVLKTCEYHLRDIKAAYLMKSGYVKLNDAQGVQELRESLEDRSRTDWLWTML